MNKYLLIIMVITHLSVKAQDTLRYDHGFRLSVAVNQAAYEKHISQYATDVHHFYFNMPDSCSVYIVVSSADDSLDIWLGSNNVDISSKMDGQYKYGFVKLLPGGRKDLYIRSKKYATYKVWIKGELN
ncbi:MAG: hypothetical protein WCJ85_02700 [Chitinophagaceae bacterium]